MTDYICAVCFAPVKRGVGGQFFHPGGTVGTIARKVREQGAKDSATQDSRRPIADIPLPPIEPQFEKPSGSVRSIKRRGLEGRRASSR